jgi:hypothetical protein
MIPATSASAPTQRVADALADAAASAAPPRSGRARSTPNGTRVPPKKETTSATVPLEALLSAAPALARTARAVVSAVARNRSAVAGYATGARTSRARSSPAKGPLAFLKDPKLSIEEKLMRLLAHQNEKWEKEMQAKLDQLAGGEAGGASSSSSKSGGALGGVAGAFAKALGVGSLAGAAAGALKVPGVRAALEKVGGPVLGAAASALGFPAAAPALVRYGGAIVGVAADAASAFSGDEGTNKTGGKAMSDSKRQQLTLEIQRLYEKQKEMFSLVSSIMRVSHETRSSVIGNIR